MIVNEDELKDLEKEVRKLKRIAGEWTSQLHDLVEGRLPALSGVEEEGEGEPPVAYHPRGWLRIAERRLNLGSGALKPEAEFHATVQTPDGPVTVIRPPWTRWTRPSPRPRPRVDVSSRSPRPAAARRWNLNCCAAPIW